MASRIAGNLCPYCKREYTKEMELESKRKIKEALYNRTPETNEEKQKLADTVGNFMETQERQRQERLNAKQ